MYGKANIVQWVNDPSTGTKGAQNVNETINPLYLAYETGYEIKTGKDARTGEYKGRSRAVSDAGVNVIGYLTLGKFLKVTTVAAPLEKQMLKNASAMGQAQKSVVQKEAQSATNAELKSTVATSTESRAIQLKINNQNSVASEGIVRDRLTSQLGTNEAILAKPRIYIGDGSSGKYAVPDFAVYNTKTGNILRVVEAKDGQAVPSRAQQQLNEFGGIFRGSSRAPDAKPQSVKSGMLEVEKTNVGSTSN